MNASILQKAGLTQNESIAYLTLLTSGSLKASEILKKANLNSGKIYELLEGLKNKGLVSESNQNNIRFFTASPPKQILEYLTKQEEEFLIKKELIKKELPLLEKSRKNYVLEAKSITYTGLKGLRTAAYEALDSMKPGEEILTMGTISKKDKEINDFWIKFGAKRIAKRIPNRLIFSDKGPHFLNTKNMSLIQTRFLPSITPATVDVFGEDKIIIFNYEQPITSILIYDKNIAQSFKQFFEQLWAQAKP